MDLEHAERDAAIGHLLPNLHQVLLDVLQDRVPVLVRQNLTNHIAEEEKKEQE